MFILYLGLQPFRTSEERAWTAPSPIYDVLYDWNHLERNPLLRVFPETDRHQVKDLILELVDITEKPITKQILKEELIQLVQRQTEDVKSALRKLVNTAMANSIEHGNNPRENNRKLLRIILIMKSALSKDERSSAKFTHDNTRLIDRLTTSRNTSYCRHYNSIQQAMNEAMNLKEAIDIAQIESLELLNRTIESQMSWKKKEGEFVNVNGRIYDVFKQLEKRIVEGSKTAFFIDNPEYPEYSLKYYRDLVQPFKKAKQICRDSLCNARITHLEPRLSGLRYTQRREETQLTQEQSVILKKNIAELELEIKRYNEYRDITKDYSNINEVPETISEDFLNTPINKVHFISALWNWTPETKYAIGLGIDSDSLKKLFENELTPASVKIFTQKEVFLADENTTIRELRDALSNRSHNFMRDLRIARKGLSNLRTVPSISRPTAPTSSGCSIQSTAPTEHCRCTCCTPTISTTIRDLIEGIGLFLDDLSR